MTPKEKAKELVHKFDGIGLQMRNEAIACAIICVDEVVLHCNQYEWQYWEEVKQEINKL
jgi:hypothetical protein